MSNLYRTQIYVEKEQMRQLKIDSERCFAPVSELIRRAIKRYLTAEATDLNWDNDPISKTIGKIKLTVNDASEKHNQYLYEKRKKVIG